MTMEPVPMPTREPEAVALTPQQLKSRRARNIAIGLIVGLMVVLVYALTIAKLGSHVAERAM